VNVPAPIARAGLKRASDTQPAPHPVLLPLAVSDRDLSTDALWTRGVAGDSTAFGLILDARQDRVFRHACRIL
jgi:hypothetical protein